MLTQQSSAAAGTTTAPEGLLISHIQAHIKQGEKAKERAEQARDKAEQHFIAAGQYLTMLKVTYAPTWQQWETILKVKVKLSTGRASELMQLADGRKNLQEIRDGKAQSMARLRAGSSPQAKCGEEKSAVVVSIAPHEFPCVRDTASSVIDDLIDDGIRETVVKMVLEGERQSAFDDFRNAVADLYQQLLRAVRQ